MAVAVMLATTAQAQRGFGGGGSRGRSEPVLPNASFSTLTIGATQLVVQDALEITSCRCGS